MTHRYWAAPLMWVVVASCSDSAPGNLADAAPETSCTPACGDGFHCAAGECLKNQCAPPCAAGEICREHGAAVCLCGDTPG